MRGRKNEILIFILLSVFTIEKSNSTRITQIARKNKGTFRVYEREQDMTVLTDILGFVKERFGIGTVVVHINEGTQNSRFIERQLQAYAKLYIPTAPFGILAPNKTVNSLAKRVAPHRHGIDSPFTLHANLPLECFYQFEDSRCISWTKVLSKLNGFEASTIQRAVGVGNEKPNAVYKSLLNKLLYRDFFLNMDKYFVGQSGDSKGVLNTYLTKFTIRPRLFLSLYFGEYSNSSLKQDSLIAEDKADPDHEKITVKIVCPFCKPTSIPGSSELDKMTQLSYRLIQAFNQSNSSVNLQTFPLNTTTKARTESPKLGKGHPLDGQSARNFNQGIMYNSLVFISRKPPSADVLSPFTITSWIGIVLTYAVTAIVFGLVKAITMNNLDQSFYDYVIQQLLKIMSDDDNLTSVKEELVTAVVVVNVKPGNDSVYSTNTSDLMDDTYSSTSSTHVQSSGIVGTTKLSDNSDNNQYNAKPTNYPTDDNDANSSARHAARGKASKAIFHGTIRILSFVLLATYEGKLYNSITFPKSRLVSTFEDLFTSEKYSIKVTKEAEQAGFGVQFNRLIQAQNEYDRQSNYDDSRFIHSKSTNRTWTTTTNNGVHNDNNYASNNVSGYANTSKNDGSLSILMGSVNIEDCINWVETSSNSNHACVGYEFELRNLHKTHRFDKLMTKSNGRLVKYGVRNPMRKGSRFFPGAFHISKWILESGIMQLWNMAESAFTESIAQNNFTPSNVFTIRDYSGLFMVYFLLLFLSLLLFISEFGIGWAQRRFGLISAKDYFRFMKRAGKNSISYAKDLPQRWRVTYRRVFGRNRRNVVFSAV